MRLWITVAALAALGAARALPPRRARLTLAERPASYYYTNINGVPGTYSFGYDTAADGGGGGQYRTEERLADGSVRGAYGYLDPRGRPVRYTYVADRRGYRVMRDREGEARPAPAHYAAAQSSAQEVTWSRNKNKQPNRRTPSHSHPNAIAPSYFTYS